MARVKQLEFGDVNYFEIIASSDGTALVTVGDYEGGASFDLSVDQFEKLRSFLLEEDHGDD